MALELPYGIQVVNPVYIDKRYGPYANVAAAKAGVPLSIRVLNLVVGITNGDIIDEYWWHEGITDDDLEIKASSGGGDNLATAALSATGNYTHQWNGYGIQIQNISNFALQNNSISYFTSTPDMFRIAGAALDGGGEMELLLMTVDGFQIKMAIDHQEYNLVRSNNGEFVVSRLFNSSIGYVQYDAMAHDEFGFRIHHAWEYSGGGAQTALLMEISPDGDFNLYNTVPGTYTDQLALHLTNDGSFYLHGLDINTANYYQRFSYEANGDLFIYSPTELLFHMNGLGSVFYVRYNDGTSPNIPSLTMSALNNSNAYGSGDPKADIEVNESSRLIIRCDDDPGGGLWFKKTAGSYNSSSNDIWHIGLVPSNFYDTNSDYTFEISMHQDNPNRIPLISVAKDDGTGSITSMYFAANYYSFRDGIGTTGPYGRILEIDSSTGNVYTAYISNSAHILTDSLKAENYLYINTILNTTYRFNLKGFARIEPAIGSGTIVLGNFLSGGFAGLYDVDNLGIIADSNSSNNTYRFGGGAISVGINGVGIGLTIGTFASYKLDVAGDIHYTGGLLGPYVNSISIAVTSYTATKPGIYRITTGDGNTGTKYFIPPDASAWLGSTLILINASSDNVLINGVFSVPPGSITTLISFGSATWAGYYVTAATAYTG